MKQLGVNARSPQYLKRISGDDLMKRAQKKRKSGASMDGWAMRDLARLPVEAFDQLAHFIKCVFFGFAVA